jgi:hypothetical protein
MQNSEITTEFVTIVCTYLMPSYSLSLSPAIDLSLNRSPSLGR